MFTRGPDIPGRKKIVDDMIREQRRCHGIYDKPKKRKMKIVKIILIAVSIRTLVAFILSNC